MLVLSAIWCAYKCCCCHDREGSHKHMEDRTAVSVILTSFSAVCQRGCICFHRVHLEAQGYQCSASGIIDQALLQRQELQHRDLCVWTCWALSITAQAFSSQQSRWEVLCINLLTLSEEQGYLALELNLKNEMISEPQD